ncbi:MAG: adenosylcobinamide-GDP ribazoletransferase [Firmicutes bacterium]|nr:adenosylcobinamide-GDP ribazoletransferase [Bacillota bacterium]
MKRQTKRILREENSNGFILALSFLTKIPVRTSLPASAPTSPPADSPASPSTGRLAGRLSGPAGADATGSGSRPGSCSSCESGAAGETGEAGSFAVQLGRSAAWFPAVGALIGCLLALVGFAASHVFSTMTCAVLVLIAQAGLTGGIHLDGFIDTADGLMSGRGRDRTLEIMRDSRVGAMGVIAAILLLTLKVALLAEMPRWLLYPSLFVMPAFGRWSMVYALCLYPYARQGPGLGKPFADHVGGRELITASVSAAILAVAAFGWVRGLLAGLGVFLATAAFAAGVARQIGGITGDTCGATNEVVEVMTLAILRAASQWLP